jgi:hypothetical protein
VFEVDGNKCPRDHLSSGNLLIFFKFHPNSQFKIMAVEKDRHTIRESTPTRYSIMKKTSRKSVYLIALLLAFAVGTAGAQQDRSGTQTRERAQDPSTHGTEQTQQQQRRSQYGNTEGQSGDQSQGQSQGKGKGNGQGKKNGQGKRSGGSGSGH